MILRVIIYRHAFMPALPLTASTAAGNYALVVDNFRTDRRSNKRIVQVLTLVRDITNRHWQRSITEG